MDTSIKHCSPMNVVLVLASQPSFISRCRYFLATRLAPADSHIVVEKNRS